MPSPLAQPFHGLAHAPALAPGLAPADAPALPLLLQLLCMTADLPSVLDVRLLSCKYNTFAMFVFTCKPQLGHLQRTHKADGTPVCLC